MSKLIVLNNLGTVELERTITNLYAKKLISKNEIKEFINSLKVLVDNLPDHDETFVH